MKLDIEINGQKKEVDFIYSEGRASLTVDGISYDAQASQPEPGLYTIIINNKIYSSRPENKSEVIVNGQRIAISLHDRKSYRGKNGSAGAADGKASIKAPMPGKVVRILINEGDEVQAKQGVIIVEAMKMQNEVLSPKTGTVSSIKVSEGQIVNAGDVMIIIE